MRPDRGVGAGGPAAGPAVPAFFGDVAGFGGGQIAACGDGRGVQRRPVPLDRQQVIGAAVPGQVAGGAGAGVGCVGGHQRPGDVHLAQQRAHLGGLGGALGNGDLPGHQGVLPLGPVGGLGGALGNGDLPGHHGVLPLGPVGHRREQHQPAVVVPAAAQVLAVQRDCPAAGVTAGVLAQPRSHRPTGFAGVQRDQHPPQRACTGRDEDQAGQIPAGTQQGQQFLGQAGRG
jgi:hypothetical protein